MSKRKPSLLLDDIRTSISKIERYIASLDEASFLADEKTIDAVVRNLEIIGEAVKQLPAEFKVQHSAIPWPQIAGLRNRIVHDYAGHRSETCLEYFADSDSQAGGSDRRVEIAAITAGLCGRVWRRSRAPSAPSACHAEAPQSVSSA